MKNIILFICLFCLGLPAMAQKQDKCSKEEFRAKKEAYLKETAGLTDEEAKEFFPLYFQLEDLKKDIKGKIWTKARKGKKPGTTEEEYEDIVDDFVNIQIQAAELDKEYLEKFKNVLSSKKIYMVLRAEIKFNRNILKIIHPDKDKKKE